MQVSNFMPLFWVPNGIKKRRVCYQKIDPPTSEALIISSDTPLPLCPYAQRSSLSSTFTKFIPKRMPLKEAYLKNPNGDMRLWGCFNLYSHHWDWIPWWCCALELFLHSLLDLGYHFWGIIIVHDRLTWCENLSYLLYMSTALCPRVMIFRPRIGLLVCKFIISITSNIWKIFILS